MASYFNRRGITPKTSIVPDMEMKVKFTAFRFIWTHSATCTDHSCCKNYCWNTPATWVELCNTSLVCHECQQVASMIVETLRRIRGDEQLYLFWTKVISKSGAIYVDVQALYRRRKTPMRFGGYFTKTAKHLHRQEYIEANNTINACIQDRPD